MQTWEYKYIVQARGFKARDKDVYYHWAGEWDVMWEDEKQLPNGVKIVEKLRELGDAGWELVTVVPRSGMTGTVSTIPGSTDYAGFTSEQLWVFKRPK